jgi:hypothetical protein
LDIWPMDPLDAFWHFGNFFGPAFWVAALLAAAVKLLWQRELKTHAWSSLVWRGAVGGSLGLLLALALLGRDGKMAGYGLMLIGISLPQAWLLFKPAR